MSTPNVLNNDDVLLRSTMRTVGFAPNETATTFKTHQHVGKKPSRLVIDDPIGNQSIIES